MSNQEIPDQEPEAPIEPKAIPAVKGRRSFAKLRRELSEEELSSPAVQKLLIDDIERLEKDNALLSEYRDKFHASDKQVSIFKEREKKGFAQEVVFSVTLVVGAAALGFAPSLWNSQPGGWITIVFGTVLILGGIVSRIVKR